MDMTIQVGKERMSGKGEEIVKQMASLVKTREFENTDDYIEWVSQGLWRLERIGIQVIGETPAERAYSLLDALNRSGKIRIINTD